MASCGPASPLLFGFRTSDLFGRVRLSGGHVLHICTSCRRADSAKATDATEPRGGTRLLEAVALRFAQWSGRTGFTLNPVECMSGCDRSCTIAFSAPGKLTYLFGDLDPDTVPPDQILECAALYQATPGGSLPRGARPEALRKGILARIPSFAPAE